MLNQIIRYVPIIKYLKTLQPKYILEIGSGSQGLGKFYDGPFTGVDMTTKDYGSKEQKTAENMNFIEGDALDLPIKDGSYEFVFSLDMIEHIPTELRQQAVNESIRVSNKYICIGFPCGKYAHAFDTGQYRLLKKLGLSVPGWLQEHIDLSLPSDEMFDTLISDIQRINPNIHIMTFGNGNIYLWACIIWFEYILSWMRIGWMSDVLAKHIGFLKLLSRNSKTPYRKFMFLTKHD